MTLSRDWLIDIALSFLVYLVPLVGPHALFFIGGYLVGAARRVSEAPMWVASDWVVVLLAQAVLLLVWRLGRRGPRWLRPLIGTAALFALTIALNGLLLLAIPLRFLTEVSTAPEVNTLTEFCRLDGIYLQPTVSTFYPHRDEAALVVGRAGGRGFALLRLPGCRIEDLAVPADADLGWVSQAGAMLWRTREDARADRSVWNLTSSSGATSLLPLSIDRSRVVPAILDDGRTLGWVEGREQKRIVIVYEGEVREIPLVAAPAGTYGVLAGAGPDGPFALSVSLQEELWLTIDAGGRITNSIPGPPRLSRFGHKLHLLDNGWIGWDAYRDSGRYLVAWSRDGREEIRELSRGLGINSAAVDGRGDFIAISATSGLNIGSQRDEVWLLRTSDGAELFRRYGPKYSRAIVAFPTGRFFAVDEIDAGQPAVRVYSLPAAR
jgi:hypothetical protein